MWNSIFGNAMGGLLGSTASQPGQLGLANQMGQYNQSVANAQAQYMQQAQMAAAFQPPKWVINGKSFYTSKQFAEELWPDDEQARLMFALKYPDD